MEKEELLERYEAYGHESDYTEARRLYEQALAGGAADARTLNGFGYLQECHGRRDLRAAADCYERAIEADPQWPKPHWQLILALSTLGENDRLIERYRQRLDAAPTDPLAHAFLASAYLYARDYEHAAESSAPASNSPRTTHGWSSCGETCTPWPAVPMTPSPTGSVPTHSTRTTSVPATARRSCWNARAAWPTPPGNGGSSSPGTKNAATT